MNKKRSVIQRIAVIVLLTFEIAAGAFLMLRILHPLYQPMLGKNLVLEISDSKEQDARSKGDSIHIFALEVNGTYVSLNDFPLSEGWEFYEKDGYIWRPSGTEAETLKISLENVRYLRVTMAYTDASGIVSIAVNGKKWKEENLYRDLQWEVDSLTYYNHPLVYPEADGKAVGGILLLSLCFSLLIYGLGFYRKKEYRADGSILITGILALLIGLGIAMIQFQGVEAVRDYCLKNHYYLLQGVAAVWILLLVLHYLFRNYRWAFFVTSVVCFGLTEVSRQKMVNRQAPLFPWDFQYIGEVKSVLKGYEVHLTAASVIVLVAAVFYTVLLWILEKEKKRKWTVQRNLILPAVLLGGLIYYITGTFIYGRDESASDARVYQMTEYYENRGFLTAFMGNFHLLSGMQEPDEYSQAAMDKITEAVKEIPEGETTENQPDIILILSESFWEVNRMKNIGFEEDVIPVFHSLQKESIHGNLLAHVFGGGTVISEFEALTGFSGEYFPPEYLVYGKDLDEGFFSAVDYLKKRGYSTTAIHPYEATNYNRYEAYEKLGFDKTDFEDEFSEDVKRVRGYVSDEAVMEKILEERNHDKEKNMPSFILAVTMQNHGGYWEEQIYEESKIGFAAEGYSDVTMKSMEDLFAGLHEADRALGELIEDLQEDERETIVIYFGDHMTDAGSQINRMLAKSGLYQEEGSLEYEYETGIVPFLIWSNFETKTEDMGLMNITQLLPSAFEAYDLEMPMFWKFLLESRNIYAATDYDLLVDSNGNQKGYEEWSDEEKELFRQKRMIQYDYISGEKYGEGLFE